MLMLPTQFSRRIRVQAVIAPSAASAEVPACFHDTATCARLLSRITDRAVSEARLLLITQPPFEMDLAGGLYRTRFTFHVQDLYLSHFLALQQSSEEEEYQVFLALVRRGVYALAYARQIDFLAARLGANEYQELVDGLRGNRHTRMMRIGRRMNQLVNVHQPGVFCILSCITINQIDSMHVREFARLMDSLRNTFPECRTWFQYYV